MKAKYRVVDTGLTYEVQERQSILFISHCWNYVLSFSYSGLTEAGKQRAFKEALAYMQYKANPKVVAEYASEVVVF